MISIILVIYAKFENQKPVIYEFWTHIYPKWEPKLRRCLYFTIKPIHNKYRWESIIFSMPLFQKKLHINWFLFRFVIMLTREEILINYENWSWSRNFCNKETGEYRRIASYSDCCPWRTGDVFEYRLNQNVMAVYRKFCKFWMALYPLSSLQKTGFIVFAYA